MHEAAERRAEGRSGVILRVHATRHQALNSISIFNPVNGKEKRERENCAVATLFIAV
jgi:hypothetical protein